MNDFLKERISQHETELIISNLSSNYYTEEGRVIALEILKERGFHNIEDLLTTANKEINITEVSDNKVKKSNKIFFVIFISALLVFINSGNALSSIIKTTLFLLLILPILLAIWNDNKQTKYTILILFSSLIIDWLLFLADLITHIAFFPLGYFIALYFATSKPKK